MNFRLCYAFLFPGVNSRAELVPSHGASRRWLGDKYFCVSNSENLREREHEQRLLQILKMYKFGNYLVADPLNSKIDNLLCFTFRCQKKKIPHLQVTVPQLKSITHILFYRVYRSIRETLGKLEIAWKHLHFVLTCFHAISRFSRVPVFLTIRLRARDFYAVIVDEGKATITA